MIMRKRAELDLDNPPGQIVNPIPREKTVGGIIDRIMKDEPKKLTFDEWYHQHWKECKSGTFDLHTTYALIWKAAQENT